MGQAVVRQLVGLGAECHVPCEHARHADNISKIDAQLPAPKAPAPPVTMTLFPINDVPIDIILHKIE